jgi:hypothetical protein
MLNLTMKSCLILHSKHLTSACCRTGFPLRSKPAANVGVRIHMEELIRIKLEAGLNRGVTISFLGLWGLLTSICFIFGISDMGSLVKLVWSRSFAIAIVKALLLFAPLGSLYVALFSGADPVFKISRVLVFAGGVVLILLLDWKLFAGAFGKWILDPNSRLHLVIAASLIIVLSIFEFRIKDNWYSLFYNQRGNRIVTGTLTIISKASMRSISILNIGTFIGTMPTKSEPSIPRDNY